MASEAGPAAHALALQFQAEGPRFDFFNAVRRVECANPGAPKIGTSVKPADDPVRFCQEPHMAFPTSTLARVTPDANTGVPRVAVNFMGLLGPNGPLPLHLTEYAHERILHFNDAPNHPPREEQHDPDCVLPGDGCLDLRRYVQIAREIGYRGALSLELFNEELWRMSPLEVARLGLSKMRAVVEG